MWGSINLKINQIKLNNINNNIKKLKHFKLINCTSAEKLRKNILELLDRYDNLLKPEQWTLFKGQLLNQIPTNAFQPC